MLMRPGSPRLTTTGKWRWGWRGNGRDNRWKTVAWRGSSATRTGSAPNSPLFLLRDAVGMGLSSLLLRWLMSYARDQGHS